MRRRRTDLHVIRNRRAADPPPPLPAPDSAHVRHPSVPEQAMQFLTRYLFAVLGLVFFNFGKDLAPIWMDVGHLNIVFSVYLAINTILLVHAHYVPRSSVRYRVALWIDTAMVTTCVANDPNTIPPSLVAYIVVVLGNGMRYGLRFFAEALCATLLGAGAGLGGRYWHEHSAFSEGTMFLSLFGAIIVIYAYILMARIERARRRTEQRMRTDALTGLLNRHGLSEAIDAWVTDRRWSARKAVVIMADLDNFKHVNDTRGHAEGDRVLREVATLLIATLRPNDLIARYGGDEFVAVLADVELHEAQAIAGRVQTAVELWFATHAPQCGISIGCATASEEPWNLDTVLQSADRLLYESKSRRDGLRPQRAGS
jgi:diguanylate cyclase (GGDEF)-like protein